MNAAHHAGYGLLDEHGAAQIFFPRFDPAPPPDGAEDLLVPLSDGERLGARFYHRDPTWPTLLYFHGNGEIASDHDGLTGFYHEIGLNLLVVEFRGYGRSSGRPTVAHLISDVAAVAPWFHGALDERGFADSRFVMGRSLGAFAALETAARFAERFRGVIIESGGASIERLLERFSVPPSNAVTRLARAHDEKLAGIILPALIIHGTHDQLVPVSQAERLRSLLPADRTSMLLVPNAGHNDLLWVGRDRYFAAIEQFVGEAHHP